MITVINEPKRKQSIYHANVNINLMEENVIQINCGILININVSVKNIISMQKFGIPQPIVARMEKI